jgi:hypothetical protein
MPLRPVLMPLLAAALAAAGCTPIPKNATECARLDWADLGEQDAAAGRAPDTSWTSHGKACEAMHARADRAAYLAGWRRMQLRYCTLDNAFQIGRGGRAYEGTCHDLDEPAFLHAMDLGHQLAPLDEQLERLDKEIREAEAVAASSQSTPAQQQTARTKLASLVVARESVVSRRDRTEVTARRSIQAMKRDRGAP